MVTRNEQLHSDSHGYSGLAGMTESGGQQSDVEDCFSFLDDGFVTQLTKAAIADVREQQHVLD